MKRLLSKQFSNLQAAVALSTHAQNASYIVVGALRYYYNIDSRAAIALSTHAQNVFPTVVGALRLDSAGFTNGYRALYTCTKRFLQTGWPAKTWLCHIYGRLPCSLHMHKTRLQTVIETRQKRCLFFYSRAATALSTHAQNAL